jgi:hypothetical protein
LSRPVVMCRKKTGESHLGGARAWQAGGRAPSGDMLPPRRRGRQTDRQSQADRVRGARGMRCAIRHRRGWSVARGSVVACRSCCGSHQIDHREQPYPDDVERVPERGSRAVASHGGTARNRPALSLLPTRSVRR